MTSTDKKSLTAEDQAVGPFPPKLQKTWRAGMHPQKRSTIFRNEIQPIHSLEPVSYVESEQCLGCDHKFATFCNQSLDHSCTKATHDKLMAKWREQAEEELAHEDCYVDSDPSLTGDSHPQV